MYPEIASATLQELKLCEFRHNTRDFSRPFKSDPYIHIIDVYIYY
jgi:hypothetical protein